MTSERAKELLPAFQAWAAGEAVMSRCKGGSGEWHTYKPGSDQPLWANDFDYKPAPKAREWWAVEYPDGSIGMLLTTEQEADNRVIGSSNRRIIHVREVLP
jgi:hypothetical protein